MLVDLRELGAASMRGEMKEFRNYGNGRTLFRLPLKVKESSGGFQALAIFFENRKISNLIPIKSVITVLQKEPAVLPVAPVRQERR